MRNKDFFRAAVFLCNAFIFDAFTEEAGWPKEVLDDLKLRETKFKIRPSWSGNKLDKIIRATDEVKQHYYFGLKKEHFKVNI